MSTGRHYLSVLASIGCDPVGMNQPETRHVVGSAVRISPFLAPPYFTHVSLGDSHACGVSQIAPGFEGFEGISPDGTVWCWGDNSDPSAHGITVPLTGPVRVGSDNDRRAVAVSDSHTVALADWLQHIQASQPAWSGRALAEASEGVARRA